MSSFIPIRSYNVIVGYSALCAGFFALIAPYGTALYLFEHYDWGEPFVKFLCFTAMLLFVSFASKQQESSPRSHPPPQPYS
jgi:hypothetical protein